MVDKKCSYESYHSMSYDGWHFSKMTDTTPSPASALVNIIGKVASIVKCIVRTGFVLLNNVYCIPTYVIWMTLLFPVKVYQPQIYWRIEGLFFHWLLAMVSMWTWSAGYDIIEQGDDIQRIINEKTLVIANHQSTADVPMLMTTFNSKPDVLPNLMWIMDRVFKFTNFGIVSILHQDFFIVSMSQLSRIFVHTILRLFKYYLRWKAETTMIYPNFGLFSFPCQGRNRRDESLKQLEKHLKESYIPRNRRWMVLFPEGGFLCNRRETSQRFARKNNLPNLENVSLPRVGAMQTIFNHVGPTQNNNLFDQRSNNRSDTNVINKPEISWVLDITIAYPQGKPIDLSAIVTGSRAPCETVLFYRLFPSSVVPREPELLSKWLYERWAEKEVLLENFYKNGTFVGTREYPVEGSKIQQDPLRFLVLHLFFITSTYIHYNMIAYVFSCIW